MMAKLGPLARSEFCAELRGVVERLNTHLCWLVCGATMVDAAAMLVAAKDAVDAAEVVGIEGALGAVVVVVTGTVVVLLVWLQD